MYERFTDRARKIYQLANQAAQKLNHEYVGSEHLLIGLAKEGAGVASTVLRNLGIVVESLIGLTESRLTAGPDMVTMGKLPHTPRAKKVTELALVAAKELNHSYVGTEHVLLGLLREGEGVAALVLKDAGVVEAKVLEEIKRLQKPSAAKPEPIPQARVLVPYKHHVQVSLNKEQVMGAVRAALNVDEFHHEEWSPWDAERLEGLAKAIRAGYGQTTFTWTVDVPVVKEKP